MTNAERFYILLKSSLGRKLKDGQTRYLSFTELLPILDSINEGKPLTEGRESSWNEAIQKLFCETDGWKCSPNMPIGWTKTWNGIPLPDVFGNNDEPQTPTTLEGLALHPWVSKRIIGKPSEPMMKKILKLDAYLKSKTMDKMPFFPGYLNHRERSLEIFGDEKALDTMKEDGWANFSVTFSEMKCIRKTAPIAHKEYPNESERVLVVENSDTYHRMCSINDEKDRYRVIIYGCGNNITGQIDSVAEIALGLCDEVLYFGDLDVQGLKIADSLRSGLKSYDLELRLDDYCYQTLININCQTEEGKANNGGFDYRNSSWIPDYIKEKMNDLQSIGVRLPQEGIALSE